MGGNSIASWNARNQLVAISGNVTATFSYDALGRRINKTINGTTTGYQYDGNDIVAEIGGGAVGATYVRGLNIDEPFARITSSSTEYYHTDALGSVFALTNASGVTTASYTYDPFGNTTQTGVSSNPFQYTGREQDGTGLYYYRNRFYSPSLQRFISEDPIVAPMTIVGKCSGGINKVKTLWLVPSLVNGPVPLSDPTKITSPYLYAGNNPIMFEDPLGLDKGPPPCDAAGLFQCETKIRSVLVKGVCGRLLAVCFYTKNVQACSFAVGMCVGIFTYEELMCRVDNHCL